MRLCFFLVLTFIVASVFSQNPAVETSDDIRVKPIDDSKVTPTNLAKAKFQIYDIKQRGIIVRLKTSKERIAAYRKEGYKKVADKLEEKLRGENYMLMYGFITNWSFSPFYFMESQNTTKLYEQDTLIAKTYDLKRDTAIYMNHDSIYIVDLGMLFQNELDEMHPAKYSHESTNATSGTFIVFKDAKQKQLQDPMPYYTKIWAPDLTNTDKINPIVFDSSFNDSIMSALREFQTIDQINKSELKGQFKHYLKMNYDHIESERRKYNPFEFEQGSKKLADGSNSSAVLSNSSPVLGNPYLKAVYRLNNYFISYYCKRLDKDKNILGNEDPYYWWLRNPNIHYLPVLHDLEVEFKQFLDRHPESTK